MKVICKQTCEKTKAVLDKGKCIALLVTRLAVGFVFLQAGWGKLNNLERTINFFETLGIPAPSIQGPFVAGLEFVGGILLLVGFLTRFISIPLTVTLIVAIATAKMDEVTAPWDILGLSEFALIALLVVLMTHGAGSASVDHFACRGKK